MQHRDASQKGVTLIEMLVTLAVLGLVMGGIYGLLGSAYQTYMNTRRRAESQQTARLVMDYITFRLREIDGGGATATPWKCRNCHEAGRAIMPSLTSQIPCPEDVSTPRKALFYTIEDLTLPNLNSPMVDSLPAGYKVETDNKIKFVADLLPLHGFSESFTDQDGDDEWDWEANNPDFDLNDNGEYDYGEPELLEDMNENSERDVFGENWELYLRLAEDGQSYALMEHLDFDSLRPNYTHSSTGKLKYNFSQYEDKGYTDAGGNADDVIVAEGIISLKINEVERIAKPSAPGQYFNGQNVERRCQDPSSSTNCHGSNAGASGTTNVYGDASDFNMQAFIDSHKAQNWNIRGFHVEITTAARKGGKTHMTTLKQFVIPRNLEVNQ